MRRLVYWWYERGKRGCGEFTEEKLGIKLDKTRQDKREERMCGYEGETVFTTLHTPCCTRSLLALFHCLGQQPQRRGASKTMTLEPPGGKPSEIHDAMGDP